MNTCRENNSELVQITCWRVWYDVQSLLVNENKTVVQNGVWMGLERYIFGCDPEWQWITGKKASHCYWNGSFPINRHNNHCGKMVWIEDSKNYKWLDEDCFKALPFICKVSCCFVQGQCDFIHFII